MVARGQSVCDGLITDALGYPTSSTTRSRRQTGARPAQRRRARSWHPSRQRAAFRRPKSVARRRLSRLARPTRQADRRTDGLDPRPAGSPVLRDRLAGGSALLRPRGSSGIRGPTQLAAARGPQIRFRLPPASKGFTPPPLRFTAHRADRHPAGHRHAKGPRYAHTGRHRLPQRRTRQLLCQPHRPPAPSRPVRPEPRRSPARATPRQRRARAHLRTAQHRCPRTRVGHHLPGRRPPQLQRRRRHPVLGKTAFACDPTGWTVLSADDLTAALAH